MRHGSPGEVLRAFPRELEEQARLVLEAGAAEGFDFRFLAASCPGCGEVVAVAALEAPGTGSSCVAGCPRCGGGVRLRKGDAPLGCPRCGAPALEERPAGRWD